MSDDAGPQRRRSSAFDLADWLPPMHEPSQPWLVERTSERTLLVDGAMRASLSNDGVVEVAAQRTQNSIARVFAQRDGRWVFVTDDGVVAIARDFLGDFEARSELPAAVDGERRRFARATAIVALVDGSCWALDDPAAPRRVADPMIDHVIDAAFVDERRVLLAATPGHVWLSTDGGRSLSRLAAIDDVPIEVDANARVRSERRAWRLARDGRLVEERSPDERDATPALEPSEARQWSAWRRRALFPFDEFWLPRLVSQTEAIGVEDERLVIRRRDGESVTLPEIDSDDFWQRFGRSIARRDQRGAYHLFDTTHATTRVIQAAPGLATAESLLADDGSIIANIADDQRHIWLWTHERRWSQIALDAPVSIRHARSEKLYGLGDDGIVELTPRDDGTASVRAIARLSEMRRPREAFRLLVNTSQHGSWRAWLFRSENLRDCVILAEDGQSASIIDAPVCDEGTIVQFVDSRFGALWSQSQLRFTRDGRTWTTVNRPPLDFERGFIAPLLTAEAPIVIVGDAIVAWPSDRISQTPTRSPVLRRSAPLPARAQDESPAASMARCRIDASRRAVPVLRPLDSAMDFVTVTVSSDQRSIDLQWRSASGAARAYAGRAPWSEDTQIADTWFVPLAVAPHGAIIEHQSPFSAFETTPTVMYLFTPTRTELVSPGDRGVPSARFSMVDAVALSDGWMLLFVERRPQFDRYLWQKTDSDGATVEQGTFVHRGHRTLSLGRSSDGWGAVDWDERAPSFVRFATRERLVLSSPHGARWCSEADARGALWLRRANPPLALNGAAGDERANFVAEYRARRVGERWQWCVERARSRAQFAPGDAHGGEPVAFELASNAAGDGATGMILAADRGGFARRAIRCGRITPYAE